jgi:glyoxylase-like metal-dependent hydrolase (beta-lactamase superfamily II)
MTTVVENERMIIDRLELGPFGTNSYILVCHETNESVVVDAPGEAGMVVERLKKTQPKYILMTHDHFDHTLEPDLLLNDGDEIFFGANKLRVLHTPGHTPGGLCFLTDKYLIAGDTLFPGGPGRTQSPDDFCQIIQSITEKLFALPEDTQVYPGHGEATTIKAAKQQYEVFSTRPHDPHLCGDVVWTS